MFIKQIQHTQHDSWRYILGFIVSFIFGAQFIGALPLAIATMMKSFKNNEILNVTSLSDLYQLFDNNTVFFFLLFPFSVGLICLFVWNKFVHRSTIKLITTSRSKIDFKRVVFAFMFWGIILVSLSGLDIHLNPDNYEYNFELNRFLILAALAIILVPIQTSLEEYLFRGYLMQWIGLKLKNRWGPLFITSVIFGLMHIANPEVDKLGPIIMVYYIGTGLFLGITALMDEGIELALGFHAENNLLTALLVTADWTAFQTYSIFIDKSEPEAGFDVLVPVLVVFPIILFVFSKVYKWTNWRNKLFGKVVMDTENAINEIGSIN